MQEDFARHRFRVEPEFLMNLSSWLAFPTRCLRGRYPSMEIRNRRG